MVAAPNIVLFFAGADAGGALLGKLVGAVGILKAGMGLKEGAHLDPDRLAVGHKMHLPAGVDQGVERVDQARVDHAALVMLGALVPVDVLVSLAPIGIVVAIIFMFIVRPISVFVSLLPWFHTGAFTWKDILFLSFVRETGVIAAILVILASTSTLIQSDFIIGVALWVILLTLVVEPPLTPVFANWVGITKKPTRKRTARKRTYTKKK